MSKKTSKSRNLFKSVLPLLVVFFLALTTILILREVVNVQKRFGADLKAAFVSDTRIPARNVIVYEPPQHNTTGTLMSSSEVTNRFSVLLYARSQMREKHVWKTE